MNPTQHMCQSCGWIYDERLGCPDAGILVGTPFDELSSDWCCPLCHVTKDGFEAVVSGDGDAAPVVHGAGVVVIGAGLAGWAVVDAIRNLDKHIPVTLISRDSADRYHKPMLSAAIGQGKHASELIRSTGMVAAAAADVRLFAHCDVYAIDNAAKTVSISAQTTPLAYDKLVLAIGAHPIVPPALVGRNYHHVNHLDDFAKLQQALSDAPKQVAIIGAGMVGVELAEDLSRAGHRVTMIDRNTRPLSALLPESSGVPIVNALSALGVRFIGGVSLDAVDEKDGEQTHLHLSGADGTVMTTLSVDQVVVATGLAVDARLPMSAGLAFDARTGIVVDVVSLQTSDADIYALGDCISLAGVPCRYVAPHRAQAAAIAHHALARAHDGYRHVSPMIRLKNKAFTLIIQGKPVSAEAWHLVTDNDGELGYIQGAIEAPTAKLQLKWQA